MLLGHELLRVGRTWRYRQRIELEAAALFGWLGAALDSVAGCADLAGLARAAQADELEHAELCAGLVARYQGEALGAPSAASLAALPATGLGPSTKTPRERALWTSVALCCVTETLSTALLGEMRQRGLAEDVDRVVRRVLKDEVRHSRLGWAHLASEARCRDVSWLAAELPAMLREAVDGEARPLAQALNVASDLGAYGLLRREAVDAVARSALDEVVFPGLERFGVDTAAARRVEL